MADPGLTPQTDRIHELFRKQRANQAAVKRTTAGQRVAKLQRLRDAIVAREQKIRDALFADFRKAPAEVDISEVVPVLTEIKDAVNHLAGWMRPHRVATPMTLVGTNSAVHHEPKGVVLIIGPWNYPFQLALAPLIPAVAAGNCVVIKPSELTPATSRVLVELLGAVFAEDEVAVVEGDAAETQKLLALPFDHFFFTGSARVGRIVAEAAARHLASTTLELGGKSPAVVDDSADLETTAKRLVWGKFVNSGQTCIAPDYILVSEHRERALVDALRSAVADLYGATEADRKRSPDLCRVINTRNFDRLKKLLDDSVSQGAKIELGGDTDAAERYIAPTILTRVTGDTAVMSEEIFGPILPIVPYRTLDEAIGYVNARPRPLALYVFDHDRAAVARVLAETLSGGACVNETLLQLGQDDLPFGGVGPSGMGEYHGRAGFDTFSKRKSVFYQSRLNGLKLLRPPYGPRFEKLVRLLVR